MPELTPAERDLLAGSTGRRGYAPTGPEVEPEHAPPGAAGPSMPPDEPSTPETDAHES
ncbi:hypothetical protein [Amycolatopsis sp. MJM2582]|uniref:hypothetical protein n=1 Tax=Amycolatopsis sp. MJM2582 TaxID=1427749 RepID=UPI000AC3B773|nr:hypothetical protein [Amycolatopsis sp. MJM2582]